MVVISYLPALQSVFNTAPLSLPDWLVLIGFGALLLVAEETRKALLRSSTGAARRDQARGRCPRALLPLRRRSHARRDHRLRENRPGAGNQARRRRRQGHRHRAGRQRSERGLPAGFRCRFVPGNGITPRVLEAAGIAHADAFVALTPNDSANIVSARVARDIYRVPHVLARLHDPAHAPVYTEFGIATVGSVQTTVNRVIQLLHHRTLEPHQTFGNGETLLVRSRVPAYLAGRRVAEFNVPGEIGVVELSRAGHSKIPEPSTPLEDGDVLSFIVAAASLGRLRSFLGGKWS